MNPSVSIEQDGRSGYVVYRERGGEMRYYWEFGGGDTVASIRVGTAADWRAQHPWAIDRRTEILHFVAAEVIRQSAPSCVPEIDESGGWLNLRSAGHAVTGAPREVSGFSHEKLRNLRTSAARLVLLIAVVVGAMVWVRDRVLVVDPGNGTPVGLSVRTDRHIATLIQTLEPYTPSLNRDPSKDTYAISLFIVPLDGSAPVVVPISGGHSGNSLGLAKVLGSDGHTLWFDVNGLGGVDLTRMERLHDDAIPDRAPARLQGAPGFPVAPRPEAYLSAGFFVGPDGWLGLCSAEEIARDFRPGRWLRAIVPAEDSRQMRRLHRGALGDVSDTGSRRIIAMDPIGDEEFFNAAFLRLDEESEPLRLANPEGALLIYTSPPGANGTLVVARTDVGGRILWRSDTGIDRFKLQQILPGEAAFAFVGTRPPVPDKVPEPILVIVDNRTGSMNVQSLWH